MVFPGRVYTASRGPQTFTLTVVDYNDAERQYLSKPHPPAFEGTYWRIDVVASVQYAATKLYRQRPGVRISYDAWHHIDRVSGHQLNLTNRRRYPDLRRALPARESALHPGWHGAGRWTRARPVHPVAELSGRRRSARALRRHLLQSGVHGTPRRPWSRPGSRTGPVGLQETRLLRLFAVGHGGRLSLARRGPMIRGSIHLGTTPFAALFLLLPARVMKLDRELGTLEAGRSADFLMRQRRSARRHPEHAPDRLGVDCGPQTHHSQLGDIHARKTCRHYRGSRRR